ncbi:MAG: amino acid ABC transporter substrate-binding protein, partial [Anaerolineae bacterium]|nr:amino acid ABC transporter substrate-binding protein [Anaerolineae bacterium]
RLLASGGLLAGSGLVTGRWLLRHGITPPLSELFPGELRIAVDASYPPFAVATADDLFGLDIDLGRAIGERIGIPVRFVNMGYDGLYDSLQTGQTDLILSALLMDGAKLGDVRYTRYYFDAGLILVSAKNQPIESSMNSLVGKSLAYEFGSAADGEARAWARRIGDFEHRPYELPEYALDAVRFQQADTALVDAIAGRLYLRQHPDWQADYVSITHALFAGAVRIDRIFVWRLVNRALQDMVDNDSLDKIIARWL